MDLGTLMGLTGVSGLAMLYLLVEAWRGLWCPPPGAYDTELDFAFTTRHLTDITRYVIRLCPVTISSIFISSDDFLLELFLLLGAFKHYVTLCTDCYD